MTIIRNESIVFCDIDETLVMHGPVEGRFDKVLVQDTLGTREIELTINKPMVRILKEEKSRGSFIIVWSRGGFQWASNVIKALELTNTVDIIMTKPFVYLDDKPVESWLTNRVYLTPDTKYKE